MTLTREQILALPAGRELDALVAEKVFGLAVDRVQFATADTTGYKSDDGFRYPVPRYSRDIASAWGVVDKLTKDGYAFQFNAMAECGARFDPTGDDGCWEDWEVQHEDQELPLESAPLAICQAAILTILEKP